VAKPADNYSAGESAAFGARPAAAGTREAKPDSAAAQPGD
jgi:hypothetical protein